MGATTVIARGAQSDNQRRAQRQSALRARNHHVGAAVFHELAVTRTNAPGNSTRPIPSSITLIRQPDGDAADEQLFLGHIPVARDQWEFDEADGTLTWHGTFGGGHLQFTAGYDGAFGNIGSEYDFCSVDAGATTRFQCDVALDTGATYVSQGGTVTDFAWDPSSPQWTSAAWQKDRLELTYSLTPGDPMSPDIFAMTFTDNVTDGVPWDPDSFDASTHLGERDGKMVWNLVFTSDGDPPDDDGQSGGGPDTVFPSWLHLVEDAAELAADGVMEIDGSAPDGKLVGIVAVAASSAVAGFYSAEGATAPFRVFNGRLYVGDDEVAGSRVRASTLSWSSLSPEQQQQSGLPATGSIEFAIDGASGAQSDGPEFVRLDSAAAVAAVASHADVHPQLQHAAALADEAASGDLRIDGLMAMNPFVKDPKTGKYSDVVQAAVTGDLSTIMNSFIPPKMWDLVLHGTPQPTLSDELQRIASLPVDGVPDPADWYRTVATAVLTSGMADGSDPACARLNGPRASQWLKTQIAASKVYYAHGQALFHEHWGNTYGLTSAYLRDQDTNAATLAPKIDAEMNLAIADINANVVVDAGSDPNLKADLIKDMTDAAQRAKDNRLYWAYFYYRYNTAPGTLRKFGSAMSGRSGATDGTKLSRLLQQNTSVLTALDPSGYFAKLYTATLNAYLVTNILPCMFSFDGDALSYDLIKQYLAKLVTNNLKSEDERIAAAAAQLEQLLASEDADKMLKDAVDQLRRLADQFEETLAYPAIANGFVKWFKQAYPKSAGSAELFGSVLLSGLGVLAAFNLVTSFRHWDQLTAQQRAQLVEEATQLGTQVLAAVVIRSVRIYAIFGAEGLSAAQRAAGISKVLLTGESDVVDQGLLRISNTFARYLGDTAGTELASMGHLAGELLEADAEEVTFVTAVLGKNLSEFVATSVGAVFAIAGIGLTIWAIIDGDQGLALAADILNIVSGSLVVFATLGGWAVATGAVEAESILVPMISASGPLAILLALAGIGIAIYLMFEKPPDPVEEFVTGYAEPAGLSVSAKATSIDYVIGYANPDRQDLLMCGALICEGQDALYVDDNGAIALATPTPMPAGVWQFATDGLGLTKVYTIIKSADGVGTSVALLSLMSDDSVSFQPPMTSAAASGELPAKPMSQRWRFTAMGNALLTNDGKHMTSLPVHIQPVYPDKWPNYDPSGASGYLLINGKGVIHSPQGTTFTVVMCGIAPNYLTMRDITFIAGSKPDKQQSYGPACGVSPSTPITYASSGALPPFVEFSTTDGTYRPTGDTATAAAVYKVQVSLANPYGAEHMPFTITVK